MIEIILAILSAVLAFFCDNIITDRQKKSLVHFIKTASFSDAARQAGVQAYDVYAAMLSDRFTHGKFWIRSTVLFIVLVVLSVTMKALADPTYISVLFMPIEMGTWPEKISWISCACLFLAMFIFMAMQAKFFLKILSRSVGSLQSAITIYSLAISTIFTGILGASAIATINTAIIARWERVPISLNVDFSRPITLASGESEGSGVMFDARNKTHQPAGMDFVLKHHVNGQQAALIDQAFDLSKIDSESIKGYDYSKDEQVIRVKNNRNVPITFFDRDKEFILERSVSIRRADLGRSTTDGMIKYQDLRKKICSNVYDKRSDASSRIIIEYTSKEDDISVACVNRKNVDIRTDVKINFTNVSWYKVFSHNFAAVTLGFIQPFGGSAFGTYKYDPYEYFENNSSWKDNWMIGDNFYTLPIVLSMSLSESYQRERSGRGNPNYNRGVILSPYLFAAFVVSFSTLGGMVLAVFLAPVFLCCSALRSLEDRLKIDQYPATLLIFSVFAVYASVFAVIRLVFW